MNSIRADLDSQREKSTGYGYLILFIILNIAFISTSGIQNGDQLVYQEIAKQYCINQTNQEYTGLVPDTKPQRFNCEEEIFQIIEQDYQLGRITLTNYTIQ